MGFTAVVIFLGIVGAFIYTFKKVKRHAKYGEIPEAMEIHLIDEVNEVVQHLEQSLSDTYMEQVRTRLESEHKLAENEWDWRYYELKRFFVLCSILKEAPMFSDAVDEVWHEMLMFTREYQSFSRHYLGKDLHHEPNTSDEKNPDLRGFFDWVYGVLFSVHKESAMLYHGFYRHPVNPDVIWDFQQLSAEELREKYFSSHSVAENAVIKVIETMKQQARDILYVTEEEMEQKRKSAATHREYDDVILLFLYYSSNDYDNYYSIIGKKYKNTGYVCFACSSCSNHHHGCSSGDHSGCSSSCSSCGGGGD
jgi:hypothetical protein